VKLFSNSEQNDRVVGYHPRSIGLSLPGKVYDYEFLVCGNNAPYTQNQIVGQFIGHGAMILALDSSTDSTQSRFALTICCNLENSNLGPAELATKLQGMKFVSSAEFCEIRGRLFGRRLSGIAFNGGRAAVALRSSTLINLGRRLARESGSAGTSALYQEGRHYIHNVVQELEEILSRDGTLAGAESDFVPGESKVQDAYCMKCRRKRPIQSPRQILMSNKTRALQGSCPVCGTMVFKIGTTVYGRILGGVLIENALGFLAATGWGTFELQNAIDGRLGEVTIVDPPTLDEDIHYGNQFVEGIAAGLLEAASGIRNRMVLVGEKYDPQSRTLTLHFGEEVPIKKNKTVTSSELQSRESERPSLPAATEAAVKEVDRIIDSLERIESEAIKEADSEQKEEDQVPGPIVI
jgi:hypothetical protein